MFPCRLVPSSEHPCCSWVPLVPTLNKPSLRGSPCPASPIISVPLLGLSCTPDAGGPETHWLWTGLQRLRTGWERPLAPLRSRDDTLVSGELLQGLGCASPAALPSPKAHPCHTSSLPPATASLLCCLLYAPSPSHPQSLQCSRYSPGLSLGLGGREIPQVQGTSCS